MTDVRVTDLEQRQLIAAMLARQHLILSGPAGIGKRQLAHALSLSIAGGRQDSVRLIQGHPWWAADTADVARYVGLQMEFSMWRLADFLGFALNGRQPLSRSRVETDVGDYVICVERMSPVEIDSYFGVLGQWLLEGAPDQAGSVSLRLIGTYDSDTPPDLDGRIRRVVALVHLSNAPRGTVKSLLPASHGNDGQ
jgi:hypothetical protein